MLTIKKLELPYEAFEEIIDYCNQLGVKFFSTTTDNPSLDFLHSQKLGIWKIPSGEVTNYPFLKRIAAYNELTMFSVGMSDLPMALRLVMISL